MSATPTLDHKDDPRLTPDDTSSLDDDEKQLARFGYKQVLDRQWKLAESFAASFCAMNFIGATRSIFFLGMLAGGPVAMWSMQVVGIILMCITAAVLAEVCSAIPLSGSIYIWASEAAGRKHGRLIGFIVAFWSSAAWMTFAASNCQTMANYIVSLFVVFEVEFNGGLATDNVPFRVLVWGIAEGLLLIVVAMNYLPAKAYSWVFKGSMLLMLVDFLLCIIWLPIGASRTYGFRTASEVFLQYNNGTGAPAGWNWMLCFVYTTGPIIGFDASGHVAEETKNASVVASRGLFRSAVASGLCGFAATILFLFVTPDIATWSTFTSPQPFVEVYAAALGKGGCLFMTILAVLGLVLNTSIAVVAASRLVFAIARDGVLPGSSWIGRTTSDGRPKNAVTVFAVFGAVLLCVILPSPVAFTSLVSAGGIPTISAYALIALLRFFITPEEFAHTKFSLGPFRKPFYLITGTWNVLLFAICSSPFFFPFTGPTFNFAIVIWAAVTIFAVASYLATPPEKWLKQEIISKMSDEIHGAPVARE